MKITIVPGRERLARWQKTQTPTPQIIKEVSGLVSEMYADGKFVGLCEGAVGNVRVGDQVFSRDAILRDFAAEVVKSYDDGRAGLARLAHYEGFDKTLGEDDAVKDFITVSKAAIARSQLPPFTRPDVAAEVSKRASERVNLYLAPGSLRGANAAQHLAEARTAALNDAWAEALDPFAPPGPDNPSLHDIHRALAPNPETEQAIAELERETQRLADALVARKQALIAKGMTHVDAENRAWGSGEYHEYRRAMNKLQELRAAGGAPEAP